MIVQSLKEKLEHSVTLSIYGNDKDQIEAINDETFHKHGQVRLLKIEY